MRAVVILALWSPFLGCSPVARVSEGAAPVTGASEVGKRWTANEQVLQRVIEGRRFDPGDYERAITFFEETTGIVASDHQTFVGRLPSTTLGEDLKTWQRWYDDHRKSLYWDSKSSRIQVREPG